MCDSDNRLSNYSKANSFEINASKEMNLNTEDSEEASSFSSDKASLNKLWSTSKEVGL